MTAPETGQMPEIPPCNIFRVNRYNFIGDIYETVVLAHAIEMNEAGNVIRFIEFYLGADGPAKRIVKCINGYEDYSEDPAPEPSRILAVDFGATPPARYN